jgi:invasion protein IalB
MQPPSLTALQAGFFAEKLMNLPHTRRTLLSKLLLCTVLGLLSTTAYTLEEGQQFQDWTVGCERLPGMDRERCFIYQTVVNQDTDEPVLQIAIGYLPMEDGREQPAALLTVPLGVALPPGIGLSVDDGDMIRLPYERCVPSGCIAGFPLENDLLSQFRRGTRAEIRLHDGVQGVGLPVSLMGFTAGFNALR